jgi:hypothetical protein
MCDRRQQLSGELEVLSSLQCLMRSRMSTSVMIPEHPLQLTKQPTTVRYSEPAATIL